MLYQERISQSSKNISNRYFNELDNYNPISKDKQTYLYKKYKLTGDVKYRNKLIESNLRLVVNIALKRFKHTFPLSELIAVGNEGLIKAVDRYKLDTNTSFSSHAYFSITASIDYHIKEYSEPIHIAHNLINENTSEEKIEKHIFKQTGFNIYTAKFTSTRIYGDEGLEYITGFIGNDVNRKDKRIDRVLDIINNLSEEDKYFVNKLFHLGLYSNIKEERKLDEKYHRSKEYIRMQKPILTAKIQKQLKDEPLKKEYK